jgi:F420H(2)-dependent quinone reductase
MGREGRRRRILAGSAGWRENGPVPRSGEYEPGTSAWSRAQAELHEATNADQGGDLRGRPVMVLTSVGAGTGNFRTVPLLRVEHEGACAGYQKRTDRRIPVFVLEPLEHGRLRSVC